MNGLRLFAAVAITIALGLSPSHAFRKKPAEVHPVLNFVRKIGVGRSPESNFWMSYVAFSPDGRLVASNGPATATDVSPGLTVWNFATGRLLRKLPEGATLSDDWASYTDTQHRVWSLESGQQIAGQTDSTEPELSYNQTISPDGTILATGHWDMVALRDRRSGSRIGALHGFGRYVSGIAFSKDGRYLAAGTDLGGLQIWKVRTRKRRAALNLDGGDVSEPAFSPDGKLVAVGIYGTGTVWVVDVRTGKLVDQQKISDLGCGSVAFSPDGKYLIAPSTGGLITWPYDRGGTIRVFRVTPPR